MSQTSAHFKMPNKMQLKNCNSINQQIKKNQSSQKQKEEIVKKVTFSNSQLQANWSTFPLMFQLNENCSLQSYLLQNLMQRQTQMHWSNLKEVSLIKAIKSDLDTQFVSILGSVENELNSLNHLIKKQITTLSFDQASQILRENRIQQKIMQHETENAKNILFKPKNQNNKQNLNKADKENANPNQVTATVAVEDNRTKQLSISNNNNNVNSNSQLDAILQPYKEMKGKVQYLTNIMVTVVSQFLQATEPFLKSSLLVDTRESLRALALAAVQHKKKDPQEDKISEGCASPFEECNSLIIQLPQHNNNNDICNANNLVVMDILKILALSPMSFEIQNLDIQLPSQNLSNDNVKELSSQLAKHMQFLVSFQLNLSGNSLMNESLEAFFSILLEEGQHSTCRFEKLQTFCIDLSNNNFHDNVLLQLSRFVSTALSLQTLKIKLNNNQIQSKGALRLFACLQNLTKLKHLVIELQSNLMTDLIFADCELLLEHFKGLRLDTFEFDIYNNFINIGTVCQVVPKIIKGQMSSLKHLKLDMGQLQYQQSVPSQMKLQQLGDMLKDLQLNSLRVYLDGNKHIEQQVILHLFKRIAQQPLLQELKIDLSGLHLTPSIIDCFGRTICQNLQFLQSLNISASNSGLDEQSVIQLATVLNGCSTLQSLQLDISRNGLAQKTKLRAMFEDSLAFVHHFALVM